MTIAGVKVTIPGDYISALACKKRTATVLYYYICKHSNTASHIIYTCTCDPRQLISYMHKKPITLQTALHVHVLMTDKKKGRKKQARSKKHNKAKQHNTPNVHAHTHTHTLTLTHTHTQARTKTHPVHCHGRRRCGVPPIH